MPAHLPDNGPQDPRDPDGPAGGRVHGQKGQDEREDGGHGQAGRRPGEPGPGALRRRHAVDTLAAQREDAGSVLPGKGGHATGGGRGPGEGHGAEGGPAGGPVRHPCQHGVVAVGPQHLERGEQARDRRRLHATGAAVYGHGTPLLAHPMPHPGRSRLADGTLEGEGRKAEARHAPLAEEGVRRRAGRRWPARGDARGKAMARPAVAEQPASRKAPPGGV
mmetsp:Transcript_60874/g.188484  ORF Transcript_60874/g.188484 Transcript_60874/m.188484 type:complete len:220 (+) Transcript_60874:760-1419(+)